MKVKTTKQYDRSEKRYLRKHYPVSDILDCIRAIIDQDTLFLKRHKDHQISSNVREMHINRQRNDDWLLYYRISHNNLELLLIDLGNHKKMNRIITNF